MQDSTKPNEKRHVNESTYVCSGLRKVEFQMSYRYKYLMTYLHIYVSHTS